MLGDAYHDCPHVFIQKQHVAVSIEHAFLEGGWDDLFSSTHCEVYAGKSFFTPVCAQTEMFWDDCLQIVDVFRGADKRTIFVDAEVVNLITPYASNYYHWLAEGLPRSVPCCAVRHHCDAAFCCRTSTLSSTMRRPLREPCCHRGSVH